MKQILLLIMLAGWAQAIGQVKGKVVNSEGKPVPFASILLKNSYNSTSSNDNGEYILAVKHPGKHTVVFRSLGYKTKEVTVTVTELPYRLDVKLEDEALKLQELVITSGENPALAVMRNAIAARRENSRKTSSFEADFYSKGIFRLVDVPKKILGQEVGDLGGAIDTTTQSGVFYLSETVSHIKYQKPGKLNEEVIASKVSGENNGYSYNNAGSAEFDFYENYIPFEVSAVSPIANNAFHYYDFVLESSFFDEQGHLINKIKLLPKREYEPAFDGYIYIVENSWEIYAIDVWIPGSRMGQPLVNKLSIKQNFGYNSGEKLWSKNLQVLQFDASVFGVGFSGSFSYVYSNFNFKPGFDNSSFSPKVLAYADGATNKPDSYWSKNRPIPLTWEELNDYRRKEKEQKLEQTEAWQDSIDTERNRFRFFQPVTGYTYTNTWDRWTLTYTGIIRKLGFNTVQAYALAPSFIFRKEDANKETYTTLGTDLNYGFAEQRFRMVGTVSRKFDAFKDRIVTLSGGSSIEQFNPERPINRIVNSVSTLFFRDNYMKLYDNNFIRLNYQEEVVNGLYLYGSFEYTRRHALFNNTNFSTIKNPDKPYMSNNPLLPWDFDTPAFLQHDMLKASVTARITFGQKYWMLPTRKENQPSRYPRLYLKYEKGFNASIGDYNFDHLSGRINYTVSAGNKGELGTAIRLGKFFNSDNIAFTDYRHFNGNQTHIGKSERYLNVFNFLPYYTHSTNKQYFEGHMEHNFKGWLTNKVPLLRELNYHVVAGYHVLAVPGHNPYMEFTAGFDNLGWGKFRFLRIDYIRSYENGFRGDGVIFGLTFLDILE